jgi:two-component system sensor kinase FixL
VSLARHVRSAEHIEVQNRMPSGAAGTSRGFAVLIGIGAVGIFLLDTVTPAEIAVDVLYVGIVLIAARVFETRGIVLVSIACAGLAVLSFLLTQLQVSPAVALSNQALALAAIGVTAYLAVQSRRRESVLRAQAGLLDLAHDTIFVRDLHDVITYWNRGAEELYGWRKREALGRVSHQLMQTIFPQPLEEIMAELRGTGHWEGELVHTRKDGTQVIVTSRWSVQRDAQGRLMAVLETNNDISERKRAGAALHKSQADLAHVTRVTTMNTLTSSIAHEVNQPLGAIVANANAALLWLAHQPPELDEVRGRLERIAQDGHRASEVIGRVRTLLRKKQGATARLDLNDLIQDTVVLVHGEARRHQILLRTALAPALPPVVGDRVQVQQVLLNLVMNGLDAVKEVGERPRELVISSGREESGGVRVAVQDTGPGLDPESVDRMFDAFYTTKAEGMGMGLAICRSIVQSHGGRLWACANEPCGAVFQFTLPVEQEEAALAERAA